MRNLRAGLRFALRLKFDRQAIELHTELAEMLVLPHSLVLGLGGGQNMVHICNNIRVRSANFLPGKNHLEDLS